MREVETSGLRNTASHEERAYSVNERFYTWQGEGTYAGAPAFFIRLHGCPVKCPWCDSAGTWHPDFVPQDVPRMQVRTLVEEVERACPEFVVLTGGEPTIHQLTPLTDSLHRAGFSVHLETCGAFPLRGAFDWITLSPKFNKLPLDQNLEIANEFKLVVEDAQTIARWEERLGGFYREKPIWLQPEWSQRECPEVLQSITRAVKARRFRYRAGWQNHKWYLADADDARSREEA